MTKEQENLLNAYMAAVRASDECASRLRAAEAARDYADELVKQITNEMQTCTKSCQAAKTAFEKVTK